MTHPAVVARAVSVGILLAASLAMAPVSHAGPAPAAWRVVASPGVPGGSELLGVVALAPTNVWAVGDYGPKAARTLIEHYDGTSWRVVAAPNVGAYTNYLSGIAAVSPSNIWAVGAYYTTAAGGLRTLILHYDGAAWTRVPSPNAGTGNNALNHIAVVPGANQLWAVGQEVDPRLHAYRTLILRYDGTRWGIGPSPNVGTYNNFLNGVAAVSATNAWAVGGYYNDSGKYRARLVLHWNGAAWTPAHAPKGSTATYNGLSRVVIVSAHDVWVVGHEFSALAEHYDGTNWSVPALPQPRNSAGGENSAILDDVASGSPTNIWAVGTYYLLYNGRGGATRTLVEHWDGAAWRIIPSPNPDTAGPSNAQQVNALYGVAVVPGSGQVWAVGRYLAQGSPRVLIERYG